MSHLDELINNIYLEGIEWKKIGEVCSIIRGVRVTKKELLKEGKYPVVSGGVGYLGYINNYNREAETITIAQYGTAGYVKWQTQKFWANDICYCVIPNKEIIANKYLYYFLVNKQEYIYSLSNREAVPYSIEKNRILNIPISIPPLSVQEEIVRILDKFTALEAELEAELEARKQQYEYYRDKLLTFTPPLTGNKQKVEFKTMGEIGTFIRGNGLQKNDFTEDGVPCIHYGQIYTYYGTFANKTKSFVSNESAKKFKKAKKGDLIITCTSENVEDVCKCVAWLGNEEICISGHSCAFSHNQNPKYIAYFLQTGNFFSQKKKYAHGIKVIDIKISDLEKIEIPIPPLEEQHRIVSILDKFEKLTTDLTQGLPAEIEARCQQYEYYRDKLLTFKRKTA